MYFEKHPHLVTELDALTVRKTKSLVIVKHRVHILNPDRIDRAIEHRPHPILTLALVLRWNGSPTHQLGSQTVRPLLRVQVDFAVQLAHRNGFRVDDVVFDDLVVFAFVAFLPEFGHCVSENFETSSLAGTRVADQHHTKPDKEGFMELDHFLLEDFVVSLQAFGFDGLVNLFEELGVVRFYDR